MYVLVYLDIDINRYLWYFYMIKFNIDMGSLHPAIVHIQV